ncbi:MAG: hypothetical protein ACR2ND_05050 [Solirubrobacteraceae bacterium]
MADSRRSTPCASVLPREQRDARTARSVRVSESALFHGLTLTVAQQDGVIGVLQARNAELHRRLAVLEGVSRVEAAQDPPAAREPVMNLAGLPSLARTDGASS